MNSFDMAQAANEAIKAKYGPKAKTGVKPDKHSGFALKARHYADYIGFVAGKAVLLDAPDNALRPV